MGEPVLVGGESTSSTEFWDRGGLGGAAGSKTGLLKQKSTIH